MHTHAVNNAHLLQISVTRCAELKAIVPACRTSVARRATELNDFRKLLVDTAQGGFFDGVRRFSPHTIAMSRQMHARLENIHIILGKAFTDIAARWFSDTAAGFTQRMPLNPSEESLLRWVCSDDFPVRHSQPPSGCWRTDMLFGRSPDGEELEAPYICEINARLPVNAAISSGLHGTAVSALCPDMDDLQPRDSFEDFVGQFTERLDTSKPLYIIRDQWPGTDSKILQVAYTVRTGQETFVVRPQDLDIRPEQGSVTGYALWDTSSGRKVDQWISEMLQDEWAGLPTPVAHQLCLSPINDLRTVLLLHDKRMLGIITAELPDMVGRGVLTRLEASILAAAIPETLIPGSAGMSALVEACTAEPRMKDEYIFKICRDGSGRGLELGRNLTQEEWLDRLQALASPEVLRPDQGAAVVQRLVEHHWYDIVRHETPGDTGLQPMKYHLIGSMFMWDCQKYQTGCWRLGADKHVGWTEGTIMSTVIRPEWPFHDDPEI